MCCKDHVKTSERAYIRCSMFFKQCTFVCLKTKLNITCSKCFSNCNSVHCKTFNPPNSIYYDYSLKKVKFS